MIMKWIFIQMGLIITMLFASCDKETYTFDIAIPSDSFLADKRQLAPSEPTIVANKLGPSDLKQAFDNLAQAVEDAYSRIRRPDRSHDTGLRFDFETLIAQIEQKVELFQPFYNKIHNIEKIMTYT